MVNEAQNLGTTDRDRKTEQGVMPLPYEALIGDSLSDGSDCWVIDCELGSVAEMQCPADVEEATAKFIVRAVNSYESMVWAIRDVRERHRAKAKACNFEDCGCPDCEVLEPALADAGKGINESANRPISDETNHGLASETKSS
jgi:hypothetical protein